MLSLPDGWMIELNTEVKENRERVVTRNGSVYYINDDTDENIYLGRVYDEPSSHEGNASVTRVRPDYRNQEGIRYEYIPQDCWQVADGMYAWEGRNVSIVFPDRWICDTCWTEKHKWHNSAIVNGMHIPVKVCKECA